MDQLTNIEHQQIRASRYWRHFRIQHHVKNQYMASRDNVFAPWIPAFAGVTPSNIAPAFKPVLRVNTVLNVVLTEESADSLIRKWIQTVRTHDPTLLCYGVALHQQL